MKAVSAGSVWLMINPRREVLYQCDDCHGMVADGFRCVKSDVEAELKKHYCRPCFNGGDDGPSVEQEGTTQHEAT